MTTTRWLLACLGFVALTAAVSSAAEPARPNVLFLLADDMRADSIAALGNPEIKTPHLDELVRRGFVLQNAYCLGGNSAAVCTPSRNMLLSGNSFFRWKNFKPPNAGANSTGLLSPGDGPNFPLAMKAAGYATYHHGKRGNTAPLIQAKFDTNKYLSNDEADRTSGEPGKQIVDEAIDYLNKRRGQDDRPFFMYLAFGNPHDPRVAAPRHLAQYDVAKISLPRNYRPVHPFDNGEMAVRDERLLPWPRTADGVRRTLHEYYATTTGLDEHIGRLLQALRESGELERTLVIFSADQGISVGSHGLLGKQNLYDVAMKSPLVIAGPGIRAGSSPALVYLLDIFPTVCDLVGATASNSIDGRSFRAVLEGRQTTARDDLFLAYRDRQRALRDERWKLIRYPHVNVTQLFDLASDPDETRDLASDASQRERIDRMLARMRVWQEQLGDDTTLTVPNPKPAAWTPPRD